MVAEEKSMVEKSMVERYRSGEANGELRMRLFESEGEWAIFCALQLYVSHVERSAIWREEDVTLYEMEPGRKSVIAQPTPHELQGKLRALREMVEDAEQGEKATLPTPESYALAEEICEALFATRRRVPGLFGNIGGASYPYVIPRDLWSHSEGRRARRRDAVSTPVNPIPDLLPIARWLQAAFGELVSQAEASRRIGMTEVGVRARVQEGRLRAVRVGGNVLIPVADLPPEPPGHWEHRTS